MNLKKFLIIIFLFNINYDVAYSIQPDVFVQSTVNRASQILSKNISKEELQAKLELMNIKVDHSLVLICSNFTLSITLYQLRRKKHINFVVCMLTRKKVEIAWTIHML